MNKLLFLPIDIDVSHLKFPNLSNINSNIMGASFWDYEQLLTSDSPIPYPWKSGLDSIRDDYKQLICKLPFKSLENVRLSIQSKIVKPHIDISHETKNRSLDNYKNYLENEPSGYRIVIFGSKSSLKLIKPGKIIPTELPKIPCMYLINSTTCYHFIDGDIGRKTVYIRGTVHPEEHKKLIYKSLKKFYDYAIFQDWNDIK